MGRDGSPIEEEVVRSGRGKGAVWPVKRFWATSPAAAGEVAFGGFATVRGRPADQGYT